MELVFIRHGQGQHTANLPESLNVANPSLTKIGKNQAKDLRISHPLAKKDVLIVSPTLRTLQTADLWSGNIECLKIVHPLVAPRIFPSRSAAGTLPCDELLSFGRFAEEFPHFHPAPNLPSSLWETGINVLPEGEFSRLAEAFIDFCQSLKKDKAYIVTHDGTITSYRQELSGLVLTRADFLEETESYRLIV
ncbi:histidine phosphatase family protein [Planococcus sp. SE5232]|uniref:histidine phosphatase family protein n=1 Tax=unclassified Planococcus (in: firmicutes) TaxID=2662419 RepID=UPI001CBB4D31|nr:histidine phosphatase family protein [Planococcus sp. 4-30]